MKTKRFSQIMSIILLQLWAIMVIAQRRDNITDSNAVYKEFTKIGNWYSRVPLQMKLQLISKVIPFNQEPDSMVTDLSIFYGKSDFYMQAEGMEQIVNDSIIVMVNSEARMIRIYPNNKHIRASLEITANMFTADSSFKSLVEKYTARSIQQGQDIRQIVLRSEHHVFGTTIPREVIQVSFFQKTHQPIVFEQSKASLIPIDSTMYNSLSKEEKYSGKLVSANENGINLFFIVKEQQTLCRFERVSREVQHPPVRQEDRIVRLANGVYQPVKALEGYQLSKEF